MDLVCCRNLLIYLEHELQSQLFLQFHYALNPDWIPVFGKFGEPRINGDLFGVVDRKHKHLPAQRGGHTAPYEGQNQFLGIRNGCR
jgi:hypothetical protein